MVTVVKQFTLKWSVVYLGVWSELGRMGARGWNRLWASRPTPNTLRAHKKTNSRQSVWPQPLCILGTRLPLINCRRQTMKQIIFPRHENTAWINSITWYSLSTEYGQFCSRSVIFFFLLLFFFLWQRQFGDLPAESQQGRSGDWSQSEPKSFCWHWGFLKGAPCSRWTASWGGGGWLLCKRGKQASSKAAWTRFCLPQEFSSYYSSSTLNGGAWVGC